MNVGEKLKRIRKRKNLIISELSKLSGMSLSSISDIEKGRAKSPTIETISKLSAALKISPIYFFDFEDDIVTVLNHNLKEAFLSKDFMPYILICLKAYKEQIPHVILDKLVDVIMESIEYKNHASK